MSDCQPVGSSGVSFLSLLGVTKFYDQTCVVSDFNLDVQKGEFVSLLGPSGCGKTTTLQMIAGFVDVTAGEIRLDGADITHAKPNTRGLGIVFQSYALFPHMTVQANVSFGLEMRRVPKQERDQRVKAMLDMVHLSSFPDRFPRELSGGQRQRVALARALVIEPPVLLLDEPLSNLDAKLREEMQFELRKIQKTLGTTTIMVTHDQSEAMSISDRVVVMEAGNITQIDSPYALYEKPQTAFISTFVGKANLLQGRVKRQGNECMVNFGALRLPAQLTEVESNDSVILSLRPEKISLVEVGQGYLTGKVTQVFFLGDRWLFHLDTPLGELIVAGTNIGVNEVKEGKTFDLTWPTQAMQQLKERSVS